MSETHDNTTVIIIAAMTKDRVIGQGDGMPWDISEEYEQYLSFVRGNAIVMGRRTYEIFGSELPETTTPVVVSRTADLDGITVVASFEKAIAHAQSLGEQVFVAGGTSIYEQGLEVADEMYLSEIKGQFEGDTFFPEFDVTDWEVVEEADHSEFIFRHYVRRSKSELDV